MVESRRQYRWRELQLLLLPSLFILIGVVQLVLIDNSAQRVSLGNLPTVDSLIPAMGVIGVLVATHIALCILLPTADQVLLPIVGFLSSLGVLMAVRLGPKIPPPNGPVPQLGTKQLIWMLVGLFLCLLTLVATRKGTLWIKRYKYTFAVFGIVLVGASLVRVLTSHINFDSPTHDELKILPGISFQPSELLKICLVIFFAAYLAENREILGEKGPKLGFIPVPPLKQFGPLMLMLGIGLLFFLGLRELGLALLILGIFLSMMYLGSGRLLYVGWGLGLFAIGAVLGYRLFSYARDRVAILAVDCNSHDPKVIPIIQGKAYQICQGLIAISTGGVFGTGLGLGDPTNVPEVQTDYVFAAISEEFGLLGVMALLAVYIMLVHRGFHIAARARSPFDQLLAGGLTSIFAIQTMIILAGNLKMFPLTGIPLPFITYGGSSLIANFIIVGLLLRISASESTV